MVRNLNKLVLVASCSTDANDTAAVNKFKQIAANDRTGQFRLTEDPEAADLILFVDAHTDRDSSLRSLGHRTLMQRFATKAMIFDERDEPWAVLPGVYVSMPWKYFDKLKMKAFGYVTTPTTDLLIDDCEPDLLFSFIGTAGSRRSHGHSVRRRLLKLTHARAVIEDSSGFVFFDEGGDKAKFDEKKRRYLSVLCRSKFVLCPRGAGTSSFRLIETMRAGRVPVILSDDWVELSGPDWSAFTLRVPECDADRVGDFVEGAEERWPEMSTAALAAYENWFSPNVAVGHIVNLCLNLVDSGATRLPRRRWAHASYWAMRRRSALNKIRRQVGAMVRAIELRP